MLKRLLAAAGFLLIAAAPTEKPREGDLRAGDAAPDVTLTALDGKTTVHLRQSIRRKPLVLVFGSFT